MTLLVALVALDSMRSGRDWPKYGLADAASHSSSYRALHQCIQYTALRL